MERRVLVLACLWATLAQAQPDASERKFIRPGMSEAEVVQKIGKPSYKHSGAGAKRGRGKRGSGAGKIWTYFPDPNDPQTTTTVTIANGQVVNVERRVTY